MSFQNIRIVDENKLEEALDGIQAIPQGGTTGQVLKKKSNTDYDVEWGEGGGGSSAAVISITNSTNDLTGESVVVKYGSAVVTDTVIIGDQVPVTNIGTYTIICGVYSATITVTALGYQFTADLSTANSWQLWVDASGLDHTDYANLGEVLADEKAIRRLMTIHASVDFLADDNKNATLISTIINNDYCAKWINLRDYALDTLYADSTIADLMDTADKYFYGEWALIGQVPNMTSNSAPYGVASASSTLTYQGTTWHPYYSFTQPTSTTGGWCSSSISTPQWLRYEFPTSVKVDKISILKYDVSDTEFLNNFKVQYSDDGSTFTDATGQLTALLTSDKQFFEVTSSGSHKYWQLYITSNHGHSSQVRVGQLQFYTWGAKGNVPVMTSNTAPYGTASAYQVFDGTPTTTASGTNFSYQATNPICVRDFICKNTSNVDITGGTLQGSNDGSTWTSISTPSENDSYYLYHRVYFGSSQTVATVQFYGRELKVSVPKMTSDTAPYGVASANSESSSNPAWKIFDGDSSTPAMRNNASSVSGWIWYNFNKPIKVSLVKYGIAAGSSYTRIYKVQYSDNGVEFTDASSEKTITVTTTYTEYTHAIDSIGAHKYWRLFIVKGTDDSPAWSNLGNTLQFYGLDYSEYDWDEDNQRHYIYDHGVEIDTIIGGEKGNNALTLTAVGTAVATIDTTNYTAMGGKVGMRASGTNNLKCGSATSNFSATNMPNGNGIDITNVNGSNAVGVQQTAQGTFDIEEVWIA